MVTLTIDGKDVSAEEGTTILLAAHAAGIDIPHLCSEPGTDLEPAGACRLCVVEIESVRGYPTSCTTPAAEGMVVSTDTDALTELRRNVLELMLSGHPSACLVCDDVSRRSLCP